MDLSVCPSSQPGRKYFLDKSSPLPPLQPLPSCSSGQHLPIHSANIYCTYDVPFSLSLLEGVRVEGEGWWESAFMSCQLSWRVPCCIIELFEIVGMLCKICAVCTGWTNPECLGPPGVGVVGLPVLMDNEWEEAIQCWGLPSKHSRTQSSQSSL